MSLISRYLNLKFLFGVSIGIILADLIITSLLALGTHFQWPLSYLFSLAYMGHFITGLLVIPLIGLLLILFQGYQSRKVKEFI